MPQSTVTRKGQTTIPGKIRNALRIRLGDKLEYAVEGDHATIRVHPGARSLKGAPLARRVRGCPLPKSVRPPRRLRAIARTAGKQANAPFTCGSKTPSARSATRPDSHRVPK